MQRGSALSNLRGRTLEMDGRQSFSDQGSFRCPCLEPLFKYIFVFYSHELCWFSLCNKPRPGRDGTCTEAPGAPMGDPGAEQEDGRLAPRPGRGRRDLRAQRRCKNPAGGPCSRPSEGAPRLTGSGLRQAPSAQQPAGSPTFAARTPAARSPRPGCRPAPSRTRRPQKRPPRCHRILALRPAVPATRPSAPRGRGLELLCPGPSGTARHLAGTQTGGTRDRLSRDLSRAQGSEAGIPKPQMFGSSNWK